MKPNTKRSKQPFVVSPSIYKRGLLLLLTLLVVLIIVPKGSLVPDFYQPGDIALRDFKAPRGFLVPEPVLTAEKRHQAEQAVAPVYDYDPRPSLAIAATLIDVLKNLNAEINQPAPLPSLPAAPDAVPPGSVPPDAGTANGLTTTEGAAPTAPTLNIAALLGVELGDEQLQAMRLLASDDTFIQKFSPAIRDNLKRKILGSLELFKSQWQGEISVRDLAAQTESKMSDASNLLDLGAVIGNLRQITLPGAEQAGAYELFLTIVQKMVRPNLTLNQSETETRRRLAAEAVLPVLLQVKPGEMIVREGAQVTAEQIRKLEVLQTSVDGFKMLRSALGLMLAILLLFYSVHRFAKFNIRKYDSNLRDLLFLTSVFVSFFILAKLGLFISTAMQSAFPYIESSNYHYMLPFAAAAMLVRIVLNSEVAFVFALLFSILTGLLFGNNLFLTMYVLVGSVTAAHWVRHSKARSNLYRAGWYLSLANMGMVFAIVSFSDQPFDVQLLYGLGFAFIGGFGCAVIVNGTIPFVESLFKYTTDFKLMELANMNTPILRELMIQAPGTYHHSIVVGNLVENAAEAIGANPLLARVAAYYHDIGKIRKPLYFAENIRSAENRHDKLAPSMSALILTSHVKDGVELAREHKLGQNVVDIIRQHHGTGLIKFFYDKAQQREKDCQVNEQDYRYPGPKPQTREAALIMLADAVEAAGRTLAEPTPARIQGMVQKIINKIFIDGQLDECELTLKDLHEIAKSFNRILSGIFHHRIDYPEPAYKEREKDTKRKCSDDLYRESAADASDSPGESKNGSTDDLKRLGMS